MSTENEQPGGAIPSFGDLFDEPDAPVGAELPSPAPAAPAPAPAPQPPAAAPAAPPAERPAPPAEEPEPGIGTAVDHAEPGVGDEPPADDPVEYVAPFGASSASVAASAAAPVVPADDVADAVVDNPVDSSPDLGPSLAAAAGAAAVATAAPAPTGRLFRSTGAEGPATQDAIPAIDPEYMAAREAQRAAEARKASKAPRPAASSDDSAPSGLTWTGVVVVVMLGTALVGFADAIINNSLGLLTGAALLVSSVYCALLVRRADIWAAVVVPPLAFLTTALTAGQLTLDSSGSLLVREGYMLVKTLAQNAPWVIGTTLVCLVIVLVRRRRTA